MTSTPKPSLLSTVQGLKEKRRAIAAPLVLAAAFMLAVASGHGAVARDLFGQDAFVNYKANAKHGEYMMNAAGCASCHAPGDDLKLLSGGTKMETFIGTFYVPNITADPAGIGGWSNADFLNAVINGVGKDGRNLYPVMPYVAYAGMKPEDVLDIKAYIETLPKSDNKVRRHELSFPYNLSATIAFWKRGNFSTSAFHPGDGSQMDRGRYLVENVGACGECHTPRTMDFGIDNSRKFEGEKGLTGAVAPNITKAKIASVGQEAFTRGVLTNGKKLSGAPISDPVMKKFAEGLSKLNDDDKLAIYAYLTGHKADKPKLAATSKEACKETSTVQAALIKSAGAGSLPAQADEFIGKYCRNCHGPGESAQGSFPAGDLASIASNAAFVKPGDRSHSLLYTSVADGRMPQGKRPDASEIDNLGKWIDSLNEPQATTVAATPPQRERSVLPWRNFVEAAVKDIGEVNENDRPFIRYFSYRLQHNGVLPCEDEAMFTRRLKLYKAGFNKLLNSLSLGPSLVVPETVEGTNGLLVRVDIRDLGWDNDKWDKLVEAYPLGYAPSSDPSLKSLAGATSTDLPMMRTDWFMANASRPKLYYALLDLPKTLSEFEEKTLRVNADEDINRRRVIRAGFEQGSSGVSDHNRMVERHDLPQGGYYWKSYDFSGSRDDQDLKRHPDGPESRAPLADGLTPFQHNGGEMIFSLPNGLQGYYLATNKGERLDRAPTSIVAFRQRPIGKGIDIINGRSCFDCHADGIIAKRDQLRSYIEQSPNFSMTQRQVLLETYVAQAELAQSYKQDQAKFAHALAQIDATEKAPDGSLKSMTGPGKSEIITWYADLYDDDLDAEALAAEFDMTPTEFNQAIQSVQDTQVLKIGLDWITQLKGGSKIPRFEVEEQFPKLAKAILGVDPLETKTEQSASTNESDSGGTKTAKADPSTPDYKDADYRDDAFKDDPSKATKLTLSVDVKKTNVLVDERLAFHVTANHACELQIFYVEADGNVEVIPQSMIGDKFLDAGKPRLIPAEDSGELVFDTPAANETLLLFCREGGLGNQRLSAADARKLVKKSGQPAARGLAIQLYEQNKAEAKKDTKLKGASAINMVTFNIKEKS